MYLSIRWRLVFSIVGPLVIITVFVMWLTLGRIYDYAIQQLYEQSTQSAKGYATDLDRHFRILAQVARDAAAILEISGDPDEAMLYALLRSNVNRNPLIYGSAIAFEPYQFSQDKQLFSPYVYRSGDALKEIDIGSQSYDYTDEKWEWYAKTKLTGKPLWTEPYFDEGAGNILMVTFSVPFFINNKFTGVTTIDVPLEHLQQEVSRQYLYGHPFVIISKEGKFITHPIPEKILVATIQQTSAETNDPTYKLMAEKLLAGDSGVLRVNSLESISDQPHWIFYAPIKSTGWMFSTAVLEDELLSYLHKQITRAIIGLGLILVLVIISILIVSNRITRPLTSLARLTTKIGEGNFSTQVKNVDRKDEIGKLAKAFSLMVQQLQDHIEARTSEAAAREATESELRIAREIQASLLPDEFPPYPDNDEFDLYAINLPAKQVGGDFFDYFFIEDDKLLLVIGDVSGKGTPAAIVMAVARTLIRDLARNTSSPEEILTETNHLLVEVQKHPVFITIFLAVYEITTGKIKYVNAGHQPPYVLNVKNEIKKFGVTTSTIVGMLDDAKYTECEAQLEINECLVAYTDGIPDARSPEGHFFGEGKFIEILKSNVDLSVKEQCEKVMDEISKFQSEILADDATLLILKHCK